MQASRSATVAWVDLGTVVTVHGLRGEVVVQTAGDGPEGITRYGGLYWFPPGGAAGKPVTIEEFRVHRGMALLKIEGVDGREEALEYVGGRIRVRRTALVPLEDGRYYVIDLIGLNVETTDGRSIGPVRDVLETGANDVYVVDHDGREVLIPAVDTIVKSIDVAGGTIVIEAMEGLLD